jgi:uncharacterized protein (TIGR00369 family)
MKKLKNPFHELEGFECFGCSKKNVNGLQMEFFDAGEELVAEIDPKRIHQGYFDVLHGGMQSTILDEIACWAVYTHSRTAGVTSRLDIRFKNPVMVNEGKLTAKARVIDKQRRIHTVKTELFDANGKLGAEAEVQYFVYPEKLAKDKLHYPGYEAFYQDGEAPE